MINTVDHNISLDLVTSTVRVSSDIKIKRQDTLSHKFNFTLTEAGIAYNLTNLTAKAFFTKSDGNIVYEDCTIDNAAGGLLSATLNTQCLTCPGFVHVEITIFGTAGEILTSPSFAFRVLNVDRSDEAIESTSEYSELDSTLSALQYHNDHSANVLNYGAIPNSTTSDVGAIINTMFARSDITRVIVTDTYYVGTTIVVPENKELYLLRGALLYLYADINMIQLTHDTTLYGGRLKNKDIANYTKAMVYIPGETPSATRNIKVRDVSITSTNNTGTAIELDGNVGGMSFVEIRGVKTYFFEYGIKASYTMPPGWITMCSIEATVEQAYCSADLQIEGSTIVLYGQTGVANATSDYAVIIREDGNTVVNLICDTGLTGKIPYGLLLDESSAETKVYQNVGTLHDKGDSNIVFASDTGDRRYGMFSRYQALPTNPLHNVDKRLFLYSTTADNTTTFYSDAEKTIETGHITRTANLATIPATDVGVVGKIFNPSVYDTYVYSGDGLAASYEIEILLGAQVELGSVGYSCFASGNKPANGVKIEVRGADSVTWTTIADGATATDFLASVPYLKQMVTAIRFTFSLLGSAQVKLRGIFASGGTEGGFLSNSGGKMYGNLDLNQKYLKNALLDKGATEDRPATPLEGQVFYDTTLDKPIYHNGSDWEIMSEFDDSGFRRIGMFGRYQGLPLNPIHNTSRRLSYTVTKTNVTTWPVADADMLGYLCIPNTTDTYIYATEGTTDGTYVIEILLGATIEIGSIGYFCTTLANSPDNAKIEVRASDNTAWTTLSDEEGLSDYLVAVPYNNRNATGIRFTFKVVANSGKQIKLRGLFASGGLEGNFLSNSGGKMYGDIEFYATAKGCIVVTPDGTKRYRIGVDNTGALTTTLVT